MRPALADGGTLDHRPTDGARLTRPPIDQEIVMKIPASIDPVYAGAVVADAFFQHLPDGLPQPVSLFFSDRIRKRQGMKFCQVQSFIGIDIAQSSKERLVEQEGFELPPADVQGGI